MTDIQKLKDEAILEKIPVLDALRLLATGFLAGKDRLQTPSIEGVFHDSYEWTMEDILQVEDHYRKTGLAKSPDGRAFLAQFENMKEIALHVGPDSNINARQFAAEIASIQNQARGDVKKALVNIAENFAAEAALQTFQRLGMDPSKTTNKEESTQREEMLDQVSKYVQDQILMGN